MLQLMRERDVLRHEEQRHQRNLQPAAGYCFVPHCWGNPVAIITRNNAGAKRVAMIEEAERSRHIIP